MPRCCCKGVGVAEKRQPRGWWWCCCCCCCRCISHVARALFALILTALVVLAIAQSIISLAAPPPVGGLVYRLPLQLWNPSLSKDHRGVARFRGTLSLPAHVRVPVGEEKCRRFSLLELFTWNTTSLQVPDWEKPLDYSTLQSLQRDGTVGQQDEQLAARDRRHNPQQPQWQEDTVREEDSGSRWWGWWRGHQELRATASMHRRVYFDKRVNCTEMVWTGPEDGRIVSDETGTTVGIVYNNANESQRYLLYEPWAGKEQPGRFTEAAFPKPIQLVWPFAGKIEKNWVPWLPPRQTSAGKNAALQGEPANAEADTPEILMVSYELLPEHVVLACRLVPPEAGSCKEVARTPVPLRLRSAWGVLHGGSAPVLWRPDTMLAFAHVRTWWSWYTTVAYTFKASPPYTIQQVSVSWTWSPVFERVEFAAGAWLPDVPLSAQQGLQQDGSNTHSQDTGAGVPPGMHPTVAVSWGEGNRVSQFAEFSRQDIDAVLALGTRPYMAIVWHPVIQVVYIGVLFVLCLRWTAKCQRVVAARMGGCHWRTRSFGWAVLCVCAIGGLLMSAFAVDSSSAPSFRFPLHAARAIANSTRTTLSNSSLPNRRL